MAGPCGELHATGTGDPSAGDCGVSRGPASYDFYFYQGDDERRTIIWQDPPGTAAADLTDAAIEMQIRVAEADNESDVLCEVSVGDGVTITDGPSATFEVYFSAAKTVLLVGSDPYVYDLQVTPDGGDTTTIMRGKVYFDLEVTRD